MRLFIFWLLYIIGRVTLKKIITFIIALSVGLLIIGLLFSCKTLDKAIFKVASETEFTPAQEALLATKFNQMFPPYEYISEGTKKEDSTGFKESYKAIEQALKDASTDVENLINEIETKGQDNEVLRNMLFEAKRKVDILEAKKEVYHTIPCPESHTTDTAYRESAAKLKVLQIKYDALDRESAAKNITIDNANAAKDKAEKDLADAIAKYWKMFWYGVAAGAGGIIGITVFLKLKSII